MKKVLFAGLVAAALSTPVLAQDLDITITNLTHGSHFTPLLVAAHADTIQLFQTGTAASMNLQAMAEGGDISGLSTDLDAAGADKVADPVPGLLAPGVSTSFSLSTSAGNDRLSIVAMILPTNDGFVGLDSLEVPTTPGSYTYDLKAYDAGTELNDEDCGNIPGPLSCGGGEGYNMAPGEGFVYPHPGTHGENEISAEDFSWADPVAMVTTRIVN